MPTRRLAVVLALAALPAGAEAPLSAIDWLSQSVAAPAPAPAPPPGPAVTENALPAPVATTTLDGGSNVDALGLLSPRVTGLPVDLWGLGQTDAIAAALSRERTTTLPALRQLLMTLLLAEATPPPDSGGTGMLFRARIDQLLALGALDQAAALLAQAKSPDAELFRRRFDVALLTGTEDQACRDMLVQAALAPTFPARIFCLARSGDWNAAALSLRTGVALGQIDADDEVLLGRFLDPELFEGEPVPPPPMPVTPLDWRIFEAIGEPLPTSNLPLAFAHADLSDRTGWKAQVEAAERLVRAGVIAPNQWLGLYSQRDPAASGGVWDRIAALQAFEGAVRAGEAEGIARELTRVWPMVEQAELEVPFAALHGTELARLGLPDPAGRIAFRAGLLSADYRRIAANPTEPFLSAIAAGRADGGLPPGNLGRAIAPAFALDAKPSAEAMTLLDDRRLGEALLTAIDQIERGVGGDLNGVTEGLVLLRHVGLEDVARRTALELLILERRG
jgi:hypothetical protein